MSQLSRRSVLAATAALAAGPAWAQSAPETVAYGHGPRQRIDLYLPPDATEPVPILIFLPGGGWRTHGRTEVWDMPRWARRQNILFASADYRAMPGNGARAQAQDAAAAVAWMRANAASRGGDPERIFVMGHSAGGHLATLIDCDPTYLGAHGLSPADLGGSIGLDGACYAAREQERFLQAYPRTRHFFDVLMEGDIAAFAPADRITPETPSAPILLLYASDRGYATEQNLAFARALEAAGRPYRLYDDPRADHISMAQAFGRHGDRLGLVTAQFIRTGRLR